MRKLMYFSIGFAVACGVCAYVEGTIGKFLATVILLLISCLADRKTSFTGKVLLSSLGCLAGFFWFSQFHGQYLEPALPLDGQTVSLSVRASDYGEEWKSYTFFDGTAEISGKTYQIQTRLKGVQNVEPGMVFAGNFNIYAVDTGIRPG